MPDFEFGFLSGGDVGDSGDILHDVLPSIQKVNLSVFRLYKDF